MKVIFVSGPYRAATEREVVNNIRRAEAAALRLWREGWAVICPHLNTAHFGGYCEDSTWLAGDLEILRRCDAIYMLPGWENSEGASAEFTVAKHAGLEILSTWPILYHEEASKLHELNSVDGSFSGPPIRRQDNTY